ncbi:hypothetical protein DM01DRAFT_1340633 [Hesseltinella vesiculosa]|uniref:Microtubule associated protein n=1 Tax=Hesseltinella vesiculosa TaxID=101127 RepID=A0A1X2G3L3_9FUNG|nr:hypothetical protein DM01DRAFT_1340633 [Hesseltinella vesiculosa]
MVANERDSQQQECKDFYEEILHLNQLMGEQVEDTLQDDLHPPWVQALEKLTAKKDIVIKHYEKRLVDVKELHQRLEDYNESLGSFVKIHLVGKKPVDVSLPTVTALEEEIRRCDNEYVQRAEQVDSGADQIVQLWQIMDMVPQSSFEQTLLALEQEQQMEQRMEYYSQLISDAQLNRILQTLSQLEEIKQQREFRKEEIKQHLYRLWDRLQIKPDERSAFLDHYQGLSKSDMEEHEQELDRMLQLKSERVQDFVLDARNEIEKLWNQLYFSQQQRDDFHPFHSEEFSDTLLESHEAETERLKHLVEDRKYILDKVEQHMKLQQELREFQESTNDPKRLFGKGQRDPGRLLREEKFRRRMARELPKCTHELEGALIEFETSTGSPFTIYGERYLDTFAKTNQPITPRRHGVMDRPPMTSPRPQSHAPLHFHTPQIHRIRNTPTRPNDNTDTRTEWRKMQTQVSTAANNLRRVRQTNIRKRQRTGLPQLSRRDQRRTSEGTSSSSGSSTMVDKKENIAPSPHLASPSPLKHRKRKSRTLVNKQPLTMDEDESALDLAIFDEGPELSEMSDA